MRRIALIFNLIMLLSAGSLSAQKTTLSGTLKGVPDGFHAIVSKVVGDKFVPVDTLQLNKKNAFKVSLDITEPTLFFPPYRQWRRQYVSPDDGAQRSCASRL